MEFTVENKKLYMLQCRNGKRTAPAALKIACDLVDEGHKGIIVMINIEDYDRIEVETELFPSDDLQKFL